MEIAVGSVSHMNSFVFCLFSILIYFAFLRASQVWCRSGQSIVFGVYSLHF